MSFCPSPGWSVAPPCVTLFYCPEGEEHLRRSGVAEYRVSEQEDTGEHGCPLRFCELMVYPETNSFRGIVFEQIELQAKLLNYSLGSNKSNINQNASYHLYYTSRL